MTPSEHYLAAEQLLADAATAPEREVDRLLARAHVHALLAVARPPVPPRPADFDNRGRHIPRL